MLKLMFYYCRQLILAVRLRIEQEISIIRYARFCHQGRFTKYLLIFRPLVLLLALCVGITLVVLLASSRTYSHFFVNSLLCLVFLFLMMNTFWEKGLSKQRILSWQRGFLYLLLFQGTLLLAFGTELQRFSSQSGISVEIIESSAPSFEQTRVEKQTKALAGRVEQEEIVGMELLSVETEVAIESTDEEAEQVVESQEPEIQNQDEGPVALKSKPLNYPNPFRLSSSQGTIIRYELTRPAAIQIRVYDPFTNEIFRKDFISGLNGGKKDENLVELVSGDFRTSSLSAGVYYYLILHAGDVIGKGKMAVIP